MRQQSRASRLQELHIWVEQNLVVLRGRIGEGLEGKLRQKESVTERGWYKFLHRTSFTEDEKMQIRALDDLMMQSAQEATSGSKVAPPDADPPEQASAASSSAPMSAEKPADVSPAAPATLVSLS